MVIVEYKISEEGMFISSEAMQKIWRRLLAISGVPIEKTSGKNPKELLFFTKKAELGVESACEFVAFKTSLLGREVKDALENNMPKWLTLKKLYSRNFEDANPFEERTLSQYKLVETDLDERKSDVEEFFKGLDEQTKKRILTHEVAQDCVLFLANDENFDVLQFVKGLLKSLGLEKKDYKIIKEEAYYLKDSQVSLLEAKFKIKE